MKNEEQAEPSEQIILGDFIREHRGLGAEAFCGMFPHPFFVQVSRHAEIGNRGYTTMVSDRSATHRESDLSSCLLFRVKKREGNNFAKMIMLGRADNNDLRLDHSMVSKFHAYFHERDGEWFLTDSKSSNGTFVNGTRLTANVPHALGESSEISFAKELVGFFVTPERLFALGESLHIG